MKNTIITIRFISEDLPITYELPKEEAVTEFYKFDYLEFLKRDSNLKILSIEELELKKDISAGLIFVKYIIPFIVGVVFVVGFFKIGDYASLMMAVAVGIYLSLQIYIDFFKK